jgi:hypothetical protein
MSDWEDVMGFGGGFGGGAGGGYRRQRRVTQDGAGGFVEEERADAR